MPFYINTYTNTNTTGLLQAHIGVTEDVAQINEVQKTTFRAAQQQNYDRKKEVLELFSPDDDDENINTKMEVCTQENSAQLETLTN